MEESATIAMSRKSRELKAQGKDVISLSLGEPDFNTPQFIKDAATEAMDNNFTKYMPVPGYDDLRESISNKFKRDNNLNYDKDQIVVSTGAKQSIANVVLTLINPGDEVIIPAPFWVSYIEIVKVAGGIPILVNAGIDKDFKIDGKDLENAITAKTKLMIFSTPCNPTGSVYNRSELRDLADVIKKHPSLIVLCDEIYEHINFESKHESLAQFNDVYGQVVTVNGVSKAWAMTGWRLGWSFWPKHLVEHVNKLLINSVSCVNAAAQFAGIAALDGPDDSIDHMMVKFTERRNLIHKGLNDLPGVECSLPGGAFYAFPKVIGTGMNGSEFAKKAMHEAGVAIVPGTAFGKTCQDYVRFSFAASQDNISQALENIKKMLTK